MRIEKYCQEHEELWEKFIFQCPMATFLHTRKFLSYHKDRFQDQSLLLFAGEKLCGVLPAAVSNTDERTIVSHPGITFGGVLHDGKLLGEKMLKAFAVVAAHYQACGFTALVYKAVPYIYHKIPSSDDLYALFRMNAKLHRRDLSCCIGLKDQYKSYREPEAKMRNMLKKAGKAGLSIRESSCDVERVWEILSRNLQDKYGVRPVHSLDEIKLLLSLFPDNIRLITALVDGEVCAGTVLFNDNNVMHTQYLTTTARGSEVFALDALIQHCIKLACAEGFDYFDFGISNENEGKILNAGLYSFKAKHGGCGVVHDFYKINLTQTI